MGALDGTVKVPLAGEISKKTALMVGLGGGLLIVVYIRRRNADATSASASTDPSTADPSTIDPATGYVYGTPEDAQALADQSAYSTGQQYGGGGGPISSGTGGTTVNPVATNDEWSRQSVTYLVNHGAKFAEVSSALSKYLAGEAVSAEEKSIILQAIAFEGKPPNAGEAGYPPSIRETTGSTPRLRLTAPRIRVTHKETKSAVISWDRITHAESYGIYKNGKHVRDVDQPHADVARPGSFYVTAKGTGYYESRPSNFIHI